MFHLDSARDFFRYSEWANGQLLAAAKPLADEKLDQAFDMGPGSLRRTLIHVWSGEQTWLQRWQSRTETRWPSEDEKWTVAQIGERFEQVYAARRVFIESIKPEALSRAITYRDSKGSLFTATLSDMLMQGVVHSIHHRAQAVNMIRRAAGALVDLDYMYWVRKPAK